MASTRRRLRKAKTRPQSKPKPVKPAVPDNIRVLTLGGVEYFVHWEKLEVGASFFLPTTATPVQVRAAIAPASKFFKLKFEVRSRCEYGRYGARIWRVY